MAYIPPQLAIDQQREEKRVGFLNQAMQGFANMEDSRKKALQLEKENAYRASADARSQTAHDAQMAEIKYNQDQRALDPTKRDSFVQQSALEKLKQETSFADYEKKKQIDQKYSKPEPSFEEKEQIRQKYRNGGDGEGETLVVPGYGQVKTKKEAMDIRAAKADADEAIGLIDEVKELGKNVAWWDRKKINLIDQKKKILAGKLRLPLTGPGAMTEDEYQRLVDTMGDPSNLFSTEEIQNAKLDELKGTLNKSVLSKFNASASPNQPQQPITPKQRLEQLRAKKAGIALVGGQ